MYAVEKKKDAYSARILWKKKTELSRSVKIGRLKNLIS